jgi:hypothetical protein
MNLLFAISIFDDNLRLWFRNFLFTSNTVGVLTIFSCSSSGQNSG